MRQCVVCNRQVPEGQGKTLVLSEQEKVFVRSSGQEPPESYVYCTPCIRLLSDRESGAQLIKGTLQAQLRSSGVPQAESIATSYYQFLIQKAKSKPVS